MLQKSLEEFKQAIDKEKNALAEEGLKLPDADKPLFGGVDGMGYELPKAPKEDIEDFKEVGSDSDPSPLDSNLRQNEKIVTDADIIKAFYNIWVNLNYILVEHWILAGKSLIGGDTVGNNKTDALTYRRQVNAQFEEALDILLPPALKNNLIFFRLAKSFQNVAAALILESESLFNRINSVIDTTNLIIFWGNKLPNLPDKEKIGSKAFFTAVQFIFEVSVKLEEIHQLETKLEEQLEAEKLIIDHEINLIKETQVAMLVTFFGSKQTDGVKPLVSIEENELTELIKEFESTHDTNIFVSTLEKYQTLSDNLSNDISVCVLNNYSTVRLIASHAKKIATFRLIELSNSILQLENKIQNLTLPEELPLDEKYPYFPQLPEVDELGNLDKEHSDEENSDNGQKEINSDDEFSLKKLKLMPKIKASVTSSSNSENPRNFSELPTYFYQNFSNNVIDLQKSDNDDVVEVEEDLNEVFVDINLEPEKVIPRSRSLSFGTPKVSHELKNPLKRSRSQQQITQPKTEEIESSFDFTNSSFPPPKFTAANAGAEYDKDFQQETQELAEKNIETMNRQDILLEKIFNDPLKRKTTQVETQEKTTTTILDIMSYIFIFALLTALGAGIGFLAGGIVGAMLGGLIGALIGETVIFYLMDKKTVMDSHIEDYSPITESTESDTDEENDNILKKTVRHNQNDVYKKEEKKFSKNYRTEDTQQNFRVN